MLDDCKWPSLFWVNAVNASLPIRLELDTVRAERPGQLLILEWLDIILDFGRWISNRAYQWAVS